MDQERWGRVEEVFHAALELGPEARQIFLEDACHGDTDLRRQVELLLVKEQEAGSFLETPAMRDATVTQTAIAVALGRQFGPYRIVSPLGAGIQAARRKFMPEFLNRLEKIVVFRALGNEGLNRIIDIELDRVHQRVQTAAAGCLFL